MPQDVFFKILIRGTAGQTQGQQHRHCRKTPHGLHAFLAKGAQLLAAPVVHAPGETRGKALALLDGPYRVDGGEPGHVEPQIPGLALEFPHVQAHA